MEATCAKCGKPVHINHDNAVVRECDHDTAAIQVNLRAKLYGEMALASGHPEAVKQAKPG